MPFGPTFDIRVGPMLLLPEYTVSVLTVRAKYTVYPVSTVRTKGSGQLHSAAHSISESGQSLLPARVSVVTVRAK